MRCDGNSDPWIVRWTPNSGNACIFRIAGPASFFGRPRLGREPQAFACRRPSPASPAPPAPPPNRSWLTPMAKQPANAGGGSLITDLRLRLGRPFASVVAGPITDTTFYSPTCLATIYQVRLFEGQARSTGKSAGSVAKDSLPILYTTQRDTTSNRLPQPSMSILVAQYHHCASGRCRLWTLDTPLGDTARPNLQHRLFRQWWGSCYHPSDFCQAV
ncbi:hypothetical protein B0I37DRAFT_230397 [Chaetomium sp. MPI-CAGE-AT-0009]|nr:hypothetical protein B0I37DRAFT_230397 [Chaetomium sp. MPI-CAGE-AT-0009]